MMPLAEPPNEPLKGPLKEPTPAPEPGIAKEPVPLAPIVEKPITETWVALERWCRVNGFEAPRRIAAESDSGQHSISTQVRSTRGSTLPSYEVRSGNGTFTLHAGSQFAHWNGLEVQLGFPTRFINGQLFAHTLDLKKSVQPLLTGISQHCLNANPVIVIDPGHGGESAGTRSVASSRYEKDFTLDWALRLGSLLTAKGWQVVLTRTNDINLSLSNRVAVADQCQAALFLSLHFNSSAPDQNQAGLETYCLTPVGLPSTVTRGFSDETNVSYPNNAFDTLNLQFASLVHRSLLQVNNQDRGIRRARFLTVLRYQQRPAVLVEGGYLSNPREALRIADPAYRQKLAEAVARGLEAEQIPGAQASAALSGMPKKSYTQQ